MPAPSQQALIGGEREGSGQGAGLAAVVLAMTAFSWGFVIVKVLPLEAAAIATWRLGIGVTVLTVAALLLRTRWPKARRPVAAAGLAFGLHQLLFIAATQATSIAIVTLIAALQPLLVGLVSRRTVGERVPPALLASALLAVVGVAVVVQANVADPSRSLGGDLLAVGNLLAFTAYFLSAKRARQLGTPTLTLTASFLGVAFAVVLPVGLVTGASFAVEPASLGLLALIALVPGNGHLLLGWAHRRISAVLASLVLAGVPLLAGLWAHLVLGEPYGPRHLLGMLLAAAAIVLGQWVERRAVAVGPGA